MIRRALVALALGVTVIVVMPDDAHKGRVAAKAAEVAKLAGCETPAAEFEPTPNGALVMIMRCRAMKSPRERREAGEQED